MRICKAGARRTPSLRRRSAGDFDNGFQIDSDPGVFANRADADFDVTKGCFQGGGAVTIRDAGGTASHEPAAADQDALARFGSTVLAPDNHEQRAFEKDIIFER
jgi:hypothetical protein